MNEKISQLTARTQLASADAVVIFLIAFLVSALSLVRAYHPFYFGDELFYFAMAHAVDGDWLSTFAKINGYKPRIVFNGIWSIIASGDLPRSMAMLVSMASLATVISAACALVRTLRPSSSLWIYGLVALAIVSCRFGVMLPFDYVAGIIEYSALAFFLLALYLLIGTDFIQSGTVRHGVSISVLFLLSVFSHERYIAAVFAVGASLVLLGVARHRSRALVAWGTGWALLIPVTFAALTKLMSVIPVSTGTAGMSVTLGADTFHALWIYLCNLFAATSLGHDWYFLTLPAGYIQWGVTLLMMLFTIVWVISVARARNVTSGHILLAAAALGLLAIACLPGTGRQEARWLYPVFVILMLIYATLGGVSQRLVLLVAVVLSNALFQIKGDSSNIYNVSASTQARTLGTAVATVQPPGTTGVVIGAVEPDISWVLGGSNFGPGLAAVPGVEFSRVNLRGVRLYRSTDDALSQTGAQADFGLRIRGASVAYLTQDELQQALSPSSVNMSDANSLGLGSSWQGWTLRSGAVVDADAVHLRDHADAFLAVAAQDLGGKNLVYRMRTAEGTENTSARMQVNWMGEDGAFIAASIVVVPVSQQSTDTVMRLDAPAGASEGLIYLTLAGGHGSILVEDVGVAP